MSAKLVENKTPKGRVYSVLGIVFAVISLIVLPIVFGPLAVIFGIIAIRKNDKKLGEIAIGLGIVLAIISYLLGNYFLNSGTWSSFDEEKWIKEDLKESKGYEVISVINFTSILIYRNYSEGETAYLEMKSLGNRNDQIWDGLISLGVAYKDADQYTIVILTPEQRCSYYIDGNVYHSWGRASDGEKIFLKDGSEISSQTLWNMINDEISYSERCS